MIVGPKMLPLFDSYSLDIVVIGLRAIPELVAKRGWAEALRLPLKRPRGAAGLLAGPGPG
jgi:hypothetical protein